MLQAGVPVETGQRIVPRRPAGPERQQERQDQGSRECRDAGHAGPYRQHEPQAEPRTTQEGDDDGAEQDNGRPETFEADDQSSLADQDLEPAERGAFFRQGHTSG